MRDAVHRVGDGHGGVAEDVDDDAGEEVAAEGITYRDRIAQIGGLCCGRAEDRLCERHPGGWVVADRGRDREDVLDGRDVEGEVDLLDNVGRAEGRLAYEGVGTERGAEHGFGEGPEGDTLGSASQGRGCRDGCDPAEWAACAGHAHLGPEAADEHGDVGALSTVVGVEFVEDEVLQAESRVGPQTRICPAQQK